MSFGFQIQTTDGLKDISGVPSVRLLDTITITTTNGSTAAPSGTQSIFVKYRNITNFTQLRVYVLLSGSNIVWDYELQQPSTGFAIDVLCYGALS